MFRVLSLALVACLLMAGSAFADMKIGVFNSQAVAMDSDAAKAAQEMGFDGIQLHCAA